MDSSPRARSSGDTIAAIATPPGRGGIGIVRVSGPDLAALARAVLGTLPKPNQARVRTFRDAGGQAIDQGLALFFAAPGSFTGEDVLELHAHGGPVVLDMLMERLTGLGARPARPGEFSERALLNGQRDLAQAEAVADLIESGAASAARAALRSLQGEFSERARALTDALILLRTQVEAAIDFPEEEIDFLADVALIRNCDAIQRDVNALLAPARQGCLLRDGMTVVLAGRPNAGKSSLLNALVERDCAIVSPIPGTTRDVLREYLNIDGMPVHIADTAGLRESGDEIETEGVRRARSAIETADRVLLLVDDSRDEDAATLRGFLAPGLPHTVIRNKIDLTRRQPGYVNAAGAAGSVKDGTEIALSAKSGAGLDVLREHLKACMGFEIAGETTFSARRRHLDALNRAASALSAARKQMQMRQGELVAEELRAAQRALAEITGAFTSEDLLGRIFASFCIGK